MMCTVIAKERSSRVSVLVGIPCCVSVEDVGLWIPKVTRENGWAELLWERSAHAQKPGFLGWKELHGRKPRQPWGYSQNVGGSP